MVRTRINLLEQQITQTALASGRDPQTVKLMLVTKTVPAERIKEALTSGETLIGENKVQELRAKFDDLQEYPHQTHMIGHLQTNKVKEVIGYADCIQSLDRVKLAYKLQQRLDFCDQTIDVLVQVNTSNEASKFGIEPSRAIDLITKTRDCDRIHIKGLMTIGANTDVEEEVRRCFRLLKTVQQRAQQAHGDYSNFAELSMGMSHDLRIAIEEGSTMVRIGRAIFGEREG